MYQKKDPGSKVKMRRVGAVVGHARGALKTHLGFVRGVESNIKLEVERPAIGR